MKCKVILITIIGILAYRVFFSYAILRIPLDEENVGGVYYSYMSVINPITTKDIREKIGAFEGGCTLPPISKRNFIVHFDKNTFKIVDIYDRNDYTLVFVQLGINTSNTAVYYFKNGEVERVFL